MKHRLFQLRYKLLAAALQAPDRLTWKDLLGIAMAVIFGGPVSLAVLSLGLQIVIYAPRPIGLTCGVIFLGCVGTLLTFSVQELIDRKMHIRLIRWLHYAPKQAIPNNSSDREKKE